MSGATALPILMYHHVSPKPGLVTVTPENFRSQLEALARAGWRTGGLETVARFLAGESIPAKTCVITFDDGYLDNLIHAYPALAEFGMRAVLFIVSGWIGEGEVRVAAECPDHRQCKIEIAAGEADRVMLRWSEVEFLRASGAFEFHSHTHSHTRWDQAIADPERRRALLAADLADSRACLEERLGPVSTHLCWPQGYYDADYLAIASQTGFKYLYTTRRHTLLRRTTPLEIPRLVVKDRRGGWLVARMRIYGRPWSAKIYESLRKVGNLSD